MKRPRIKGILKFVTSRLFIISAALVLQFGFLVVALFWLNRYFFYFDIFFSLLSLCVTLYIIVKDDNPMYKVAWIVPVLLFPIFGGFFYLMFGKRNIDPKSRKILKELDAKTKASVPENTEIRAALRACSPVVAKQSDYIYLFAPAAPWQHTQTRYLPSGEAFFDCLLEELKKAERFILMEYFILEPGVMWDAILDVLKEKVRLGVEVKLIYDDLGTIQLLPPKYQKTLESYGIETVVFNPFRPSLDAFMNYRDHRKITVIDGNVGFTGGINLADEYINVYEKHGRWKDASILLKGDAVANLTLLFLESWQFCTRREVDYDRYMPTEHPQSDGFVQPFGDSPIDKNLIGEMVYMNIINNAQRYVYITTPYLILDHEMLTALRLAAQSGVDVRIITPHIADKIYVHEVTRSNYKALLDAGVKIYEFTPGFLHSKTLVCDDEIAVVGTTNFDFRSFYLHFECGTLLYRTAAVKQVLDDFHNTLDVAQEVTPDECTKLNPFHKLIRSLLKMLAPLM